MFNSQAWHEALVGQKTETDFWNSIAPELGLSSPEEVYSFRSRYRADERLNPGIVDVLKKLRGRYRLAVLSNHPPGLKQWLEEWRLLELESRVY